MPPIKCGKAAGEILLDFPDLFRLGGLDLLLCVHQRAPIA